jgi:integrase
MARSINRLTDLKVRREKAPGLHHDGGGLYLQVTASGAKSWVLRYMLRGKAREMGLGPVALVSLSEARIRAVEARRLCLDGIDPIEHRKARRAAKALNEAKAKTFTECVDGWIDANADGWGSEKYRRQQRTKMEMHVIPTLGALSVASIETELVLKVLKPIWATKAVTARHIRDNIEAILDYARASGYRSGENPARWRGHLENLLAQPDKVHTVKHHAALPYTEIGNFMSKLRAQEGRDAYALEFIILTAARVGEIEGASRDEIDTSEKVWTVAGERMKGGKEHRVPLSDAAIAVIERIKHRTGLLFPMLNNKNLTRLRCRLGYGHVTTHGFRSTFRDWAAERTNFPREIAEKALAHLVGDETERAYQRGDLLEKRRELMDAWAEFCAQPAADAKVVRPHFRGRS